MEMNELINKINVLAKKAKSPAGLTPFETEERAKLRRQYLDTFKERFKQQLDDIEIVEPNDPRIQKNN